MRKVILALAVSLDGFIEDLMVSMIQLTLTGTKTYSTGLVSLTYNNRAGIIIACHHN
jgi:hypothetical protein